MVKKKDGGWHPCGDYRRLNNVIIPEKLDLQKGYYQIPMASKDFPKTAIINPFGMFEFLPLPFGLSNAGNTFQRMMDQILASPRCPGAVPRPWPDNWPGQVQVCRA